MSEKFFAVIKLISSALGKNLSVKKGTANFNPKFAVFYSIKKFSSVYFYKVIVHISYLINFYVLILTDDNQRQCFCEPQTILKDAFAIYELKPDQFHSMNPSFDVESFPNHARSQPDKKGKKAKLRRTYKHVAKAP